MLEGTNPASWMLEVTGGARSVLVQAVDIDWPDRYLDSSLAEANAKCAEQIVARDRALLPPLGVTGGTYATNFGTQVSYPT